MSSSLKGKIKTSKRRDYIDSGDYKRAKYIKELECSEILSYVSDGDQQSVKSLIAKGIDVNICNAQSVSPIHLAAVLGDVHMFEFLLKLGAKLLPYDSVGCTLLHILTKSSYATMDYYVQITKNIISLEPHLVNERDHNGCKPLHIAAKHGKDDLVKVFLDCGVNINDCDYTYLTPLHYAISRRQISTVELLLKEGADPSFAVNGNVEPLRMAVQTGCVKIVKILLNYGAHVIENTKTEWNGCCYNSLSPALHNAVECNDFIVVELLLERGADVNSRNSDDYTPLHVAAKYGLIEMAFLLIKSGADPNECNSNGLSPLFLSIESGHTDVSRYFIEVTQNLTVRGIVNQSLLHSATAVGDFELTKFLLKNGVDANLQDKFGKTALHYATVKQDELIMKILIDYGGDINKTDNQGNTPLHTAIASGRRRVYQFLISNGANLELGDKNGLTPLHLAVRQGCRSTVDLLLRSGSDINSKDNYGRTVTQMMIVKGHAILFNKLLEYGCDLDESDYFGYSPLHWSIKVESSKLFLLSLEHTFLRTLLKNGANPNAQRKCNGESLLHLVVRKNCVQFLKDLLIYGASVNIQDKYGSTPLHTAIQFGFHECIEQLLYYGADIKQKDHLDRTALSYTTCKNILSIFIMHYTKTVCAGLKVDLAFSNLASSEDFAWVIDYQKQCKIEVAKLANIRLSSGASILDFLRASKRGVVMFSNDATVNLKFNAPSKYITEFPIYGPLLEKNYNTGRSLLPYVKHATDGIMDQICKYQLPVVAVENIVSYLNVKDMKNIIVAIKKAP